MLVIGPDTRTLLLGKEDVGYVPIVPIEVDVVLCPTFSLMGIDRGGGPTLEQALRELGIGAGARIAVVGWKALHAERVERATAGHLRARVLRRHAARPRRRLRQRGSTPRPR